MELYSTIYPYNCTNYVSYIYADSTATAVEFAKQRNIKEVVIGVCLTKPSPTFIPQPLPSIFYRERLLIKCAHCLAFYTWVAASAGLIDPVKDSLGDEGLLHEVLHELEIPKMGFRLAVFHKMLELEHLIPGLKATERREQDRPTTFDRAHPDQPQVSLH